MRQQGSVSGGGVPAAVYGVSDAAVRARTGRSWSEWLALLDEAGARDLDHKGIVAYLAEHHAAMGGWWHQTITVGYERARGKRRKHEKTDGYEVSASKTIACSVETLYAAWIDEAARQQWLPDAALTIRKLTPPRIIRIAWDGGASTVDVRCSANGSAGSQIMVRHERLPDADAAERMKAYWKERLGALKAMLEGPA